MTRPLRYGASFNRKARRLVRKRPALADPIREALTLLSQDAFQPRLRTHKLKGELKDSWSCSAGYDLRIIFQLVTTDGQEEILLESLGTHDDVY